MHLIRSIPEDDELEAKVIIAILKANDCERLYQINR